MMNLKEAIKSKNIALIRSEAHKISVPQIVDLLEEISIEEILIFFRSLDTERAADIFTELDTEHQTTLIKEFSQERTRAIFDEIFTDDVVDILEEIPSSMVEKILSNTSKEKRQIINKILSYDESQTGSIMSVDIVKINENWTVKKALSVIEKHRDDTESVSQYFVENNKGNLVGKVNVDDLIFAKPYSLIKKITEFIPYIKTRTDKEQAALEFQKQDFSELPVINSDNILVGMVTADDVLDVITEEYFEDAQISAGMHPITTPYLKTPIFKFVKSRVFWLFFLMFSATISQIVLQSFIGIAEDAFNGNISPAATAATTAGLTSAVTILISIIPDISGTSGNAGSQSSTIVARSLALGDITPKDYKQVFWKETRVGFSVGGLLAIANFIRLIIYYSINAAIVGSVPLSDNNFQDLWISFGASISMWIVIMLAKIVGGILPIVAIKIHIDPAVMAAPLLTTILDALSIVIFFSINIGILLLAVF